MYAVKVTAIWWVLFFFDLLGTFLDWNGLAVLGAVFVVAYFVPSFCIPNSPSWLALQGKEEDARNSLRRLRRKGWSIEDELQQILTIAEKVSRYSSIFYNSYKFLLNRLKVILLY